MCVYTHFGRCSYERNNYQNCEPVVLRAVVRMTSNAQCGHSSTTPGRGGGDSAAGAAAISTASRMTIAQLREINAIHAAGLELKAQKAQFNRKG